MDIEYNINRRLSSDPEFGDWQFLEAINGQAKILAIVTTQVQDWLRKEDYRKIVLQMRVNELELKLREHNLDIPPTPKEAPND